MAVDKRVRAPYNFIPLSDKILLPYDSVESLPAHDRIDPSLKTGEICVTMVADTPVFVSDGDKNDPHFFRGSNGKYMIPGSTIRGMVRENMQILGFGLMRPGEDLEDIQIYFREIASASGSRDDPLKKYYCAALGIKQMPMPSGRPKAIPQLVKSGYLKKEKGKYKIYPSKGSYMLVRRDHPGVRCFGTEDARTENVYYRAEGDIKKYCDYAEQHLADLAPIKENSPLRDFFFMKTSIRTPNEMCYMSLKEYRFKAALPSVQDYSRA